MKKLLSLIVVLSIIFSFAVTSGAEETISYSEAVQTLEALGIIEGSDGDLMLDKVLTRAEFVTMLMRVMNPQYRDSNVYFEDVNSSHWAFSDISTACTMGIVQGNYERKFLPNRPVVYEEMVKMIVCALGYGTLAELKGGYPGGYMIVAQQKDLFDGATGRAGLIVKRKLACEMLFNALDVPMMREEGFGHRIAAEPDPDKTLLSEHMKIRKGTGIVTANDVTALSVSEGLDRDFVQIGEEYFRKGASDTRWQLGYYVTYYADISEYDEKPPLVYTHIDEKRNEVITVDAEDIADNSTKKTFVYQDGRKTQRKEISVYADLIYNGVSTGGFTDDDLKPQDGIVTLIDNNNDNQADVILVEEYETILVGSYNVAGGYAYDRDKTDKFVELKADSDDYVFALYENGAECRFSAIKENSVLSVAESKNTTGRKSKKVLVSNSSISGFFEAVSQEDNTAVIDGTEYELAKDVYGEIYEYLGKDVTVYLDAFGKIAGTDDNAGEDFSYGYLIVAGSKGSLSSSIQFKILTELGEVLIFDGAKKVSLDGRKPISGDSILTELRKTVRKGGATPGEGEEQLIRYRLNSDGLINAIDTTASGVGGEADKLSYDIAYKGGPKATDRRRYISNLFGSEKAEFSINDKVLVFSIPKPEDKDDETKYNVYGKSYFIATEYYELQAYDLQDDMSVGAIIVQDAKVDTIDELSRIVLVDKVKTAMIDDDEKHVLVGYHMGQQVEYFAKDETTFVKDETSGKLYERGDIVRVAVDKSGNAELVQKLMLDAVKTGGTIGYTIDDGDNTGKFFTSLRVYYAYATAKEGKNFVVQTDPYDKTTRYPYVLDNRTKYYLYEAETDEITMITADEIDKYLYGRNQAAKFAVASTGGTPLDMVIYDFSK